MSSRVIWSHRGLAWLPLCVCLGAPVAARGQTPSPVPATTTVQEQAAASHRQGVARLRDAAREARAGNADRFSTALADSAQHIRAAARAATWLTTVERGVLERTGADLAARATQGPAGFSPDTYLAALDRIGARVRGIGAAEVVFEGSFARSEPKEPATGGHATAMAAPPAPPPAGHATAAQPPPAGHATASPPPPAGHATGTQPPPAGHATAAQTPAPGHATMAGPATAPPPAAHGIRFEPVRGQLNERTFGGGLSKLHLVESGGNGVALFDYDGDGLLDIYTVSAFDLDERDGRTRIPHRNALYRNLGNMKFRNVAAEAGVDAAAWGYGACAGDYDGDGRLDLYITNYGPNILFRNAGGGKFADVAATAGVEASGWSTGCAFLDADADGDLDLYVARYVTAPPEEVAAPERFLVWRGVAKVMLGPTGLPGAADLFFENLGGGRFKEATASWGLTDTTNAYGFSVVATDYDSDGWTDIFVANDSNPNLLYRNLGGKGFESVGLIAGVAVNADGRAQAGMGADSGDIDGDGRLDFALTTFAFDFNSLYRNAGNGTFDDVSRSAGLVESTFEDMSWGVGFLDADLDGDLDLYFANGHLFPQVDDHRELAESYAQRDQVFLNDGGRFRDVSASAGRGLSLRKPSRALAVGDLDNDGDPDIVVSAMDEEPALLENVQQGGHWIGVSVKQAEGNTFAIGARITATCGGRAQVREVRSGGGYLSQSDLRALFGLGTCTEPVTVDVQLGQSHWRFPAVAGDRHVSVQLDAAHAVVQ